MLGGMNSAQFANQLISTERAAQDKLNQKNMSDYRATKSAYSTLDSNLDSVLDRLNDFNKDALKSKTAQSSNKDKVDVKVHSNAPTGDYSITVDQLASHYRVYKSFYDENAKVGAGQFELNFGGKNLSIKTDNNTTVTQLRDQINKSANNPGFTASIIRTGGSVQLMISANKSGTTVSSTDEAQLIKNEQANKSPEYQAAKDILNSLSTDYDKAIKKYSELKTRSIQTVSKTVTQADIDSSKKELKILAALSANQMQKLNVNLGDSQVNKVISSKDLTEMSKTKEALIQQNKTSIKNSYDTLQNALKTTSLAGSVPAFSDTKTASDNLSKTKIFALINKLEQDTKSNVANKDRNEAAIKSLRDLTHSNLESSISSLKELDKLDTNKLNQIQALKTVNAISSLRKSDDASSTTVSVGFSGVDNKTNGWHEQQGHNASLSINGIHVEASSNQLSNVIDGVDLNLNEADKNTPITISVKDDIKASKKAVEKFVDNINDLLKNINDVTRSMGAKALDPKKNVDDDDDKSGDKDKKDYKPKSISEKQIGILKGDSSIRGLEQKIRNIAFFQDANGMRLSDFGISLSRDGTFSINDKKLENAIKTKGNQLTEFLTSKNAISGQIKNTLEPYTKFDGFLDMKKKTMDSQIHSLENNIDNFNRLMKQRYNNYLTEFTAMEGIINEMSSVSGLFTQDEGKN